MEGNFEQRVVKHPKTTPFIDRKLLFICSNIPRIMQRLGFVALFWCGVLFSLVLVCFFFYYGCKLPSLIFGFGPDVKLHYR